MMRAAMAQASPAELIYMRDAVKAEIKKQQARTSAARTAAEEEAKQKEKRLNEMFARDLAARKARAAQRPGLLQRLRERIVNDYALAFGTFVIWGELLGLWVIEEA